MSKGDFKTIGLSGGGHPYRVAASATRAYASDPINWNITYTSGVAGTNTVIKATDATPVLDTDGGSEFFVGIALENMVVDSAGTVTAHKLTVDVPIPCVTRIRARHKTSGSADTDTEILGLMGDQFLFNLATNTYTWDAGGADTGGFVAVEGDYAKATIDCVADARIYRGDIT